MKRLFRRLTGRAPASAEAGPREAMGEVIAELGDAELRAGSLAAAHEAAAASLRKMETEPSEAKVRAGRIEAALEGGAE